MKKICVVTASRADYGLLKCLMEEIKNSSKLKLQLIATGSHYSKKFGETIKIIKSDGFKIDYKIKLPLKSDTAKGTIKTLSFLLDRFPDAISKVKPDMILLLGDRFEILAVATAALIARVPIIHLHGGELTEGAYDDSFRHSITKMSFLHFAAHEKYKNRIIQLGEKPKYVFNVGGFGIDNIKKIKLLSKNGLETKLNLKFLKKNLLITFHPVTLEKDQNNKQINSMLKSLQRLKNTGLIFTLPNADTGNDIIFKKIKLFCKKNKNARCFKSLGQTIYLSCMKHVDGIVGNSSSGLMEAPAFKKGTINIGDRQGGRLKSISVIDCKANLASISKALKKLFSKKFQVLLKDIKNPYGDGGASLRTVKILEKIALPTSTKKKFHDINF